MSPRPPERALGAMFGRSWVGKCLSALYRALSRRHLAVTHVVGFRLGFVLTSQHGDNHRPGCGTADERTSLPASQRAYWFNPVKVTVGPALGGSECPQARVRHAVTWSEVRPHIEARSPPIVEALCGQSLGLFGVEMFHARPVRVPGGVRFPCGSALFAGGQADSSVNRSNHPRARRHVGFFAILAGHIDNAYRFNPVEVP